MLLTSCGRPPPPPNKKIQKYKKYKNTSSLQTYLHIICNIFAFLSSDPFVLFTLYMSLWSFLFLFISFPNITIDIMWTVVGPSLKFYVTFMYFVSVCPSDCDRVEQIVLKWALLYFPEFNSPKYTVIIFIYRPNCSPLNKHFLKINIFFRFCKKIYDTALNIRDQLFNLCLGLYIICNTV